MGLARRSNGILVHLARATGNVPTLAHHGRTVGIGKLDAVMIKNLPMVLAPSNLPSAHPACFDRISAFEPIADVQVMNMLLVNMVATQPVEVVPIVHLIFHLGRLMPKSRCKIGPCAYPNPSTIPVNLGQQNIADRTVFQTLNGFDVARVVMSLKTHPHRKAFFLRLLANRQHPTHARGVYGHRFFHEHMLVCRNRGLELQRPKSWRCCQNYQINTAIDRFLIRIEARKLTLRRNVDRRSQSTRFLGCLVFLKVSLQPSKRIGHLWQKGICHRP